MRGKQARESRNVPNVVIKPDGCHELVDRLVAHDAINRRLAFCHKIVGRDRIPQSNFGLDDWRNHRCVTAIDGLSVFTCHPTKDWAFLLLSDDPEREKNNTSFTSLPMARMYWQSIQQHFDLPPFSSNASYFLGRPKG